MNRKIIIYFSVSLLGFLSAVAQNDKQDQHEIFLYTSTGISTLNYDSSIINQKAGWNRNIGLSYVYFFNKKWGINSGFEFAHYESRSNVNFLSNNYIIYNGIENFEFHSTVSCLEEKQEMLYLNIPLLMTYQKNITSQHKFYLSAGTKLGFPIDGSYSTKYKKITTVNYYQQYVFTKPDLSLRYWNINYNEKREGRLNLKPIILLSLELGMKWNINSSKRDLFIHTAIYCDYGLNNILYNQSNEMFIGYDYDDKNSFTSNTVLTSSRNVENKTNSLTSNAKIFATGIKIGIGFGSDN